MAWVLLALISISSVFASVPLTNQFSFGHAIKNGHIPAKTELVTFAHNCSLPPCVITLIHVPSIYPGAGDSWDWEHGVIRIYVDDETVASISITLLQLAAIGNMSATGVDPPKDGSPFGIGLMGKTARSGGVYSTVRIPFTRNIRTTVTSSYAHDGVLWFIIRGLESQPVILGDLELPASARLRVIQQTNVLLHSQDFITLANVSADRSGALLRIQFDATGGDYSYLEACMRLYENGATSPLFLSSGAEDYFLSASYFDEGMFKTPNSGLTYYDGRGTLSAYKTHNIDPVLFRHGASLVFRNCETTSGCGTPALCPDRFCYPGQVATPDSAARSKVDDVLRARGRVPSNTDAVYTTLVWLYDWPAAATAAPPSSPQLDDCLKGLRQLQADGHLDSAAADAVLSAVLDGHAGLSSLCASSGRVGGDALVARQMVRLAHLPKVHTQV